MKPKVYIETSVISYLTSRRSRDVVILGRQETTREWWESRRAEYELFVSELVLNEIAAGDPAAAAARLEAVAGLPLLDVDDDAERLSADLMAQDLVPRTAVEDAIHLAVAVVNGMDYLVTWNFSHIANAQLQRGIAAVVTSQGYESPVICTPEWFVGSEP